MPVGCGSGGEGWEKLVDGAGDVAFEAADDVERPSAVRRFT
jgi:hypothetical protein